MPRLPHETKVDVTKRHACHAKYRGLTGAQARPSAPPSNKRHTCHAKRRCMSPSATPATRATRNEGGRHQVPRLPRKVPRRHRRPAPKCAQARNQSQPSAVSATPTTQNEGGCHQVPRLPRETRAGVTKLGGVTGAQARPSVPKCARWMSSSATAATQSAAADV